MFTKTRYFSMQSAIIASLILVLSLGVVWAATYSNSKVIDENGGVIVINSDAKVTIPNGALGDYLNEEGIGSVEITVEMVEINDGEGNLEALEFTFGPSGASFDPPLELRLKGDYVLADHRFFDESGEALEYTTQGDGNLITFYISHFSSYSYDFYEY